MDLTTKKRLPLKSRFRRDVKPKLLLVHPLFGHFGALRRSLTRFKAWIGLVNNIQSPLTLNDLAVCVATFSGSE